MKKFLPIGLIVLLLSVIVTMAIAATPEEASESPEEADLSILYTPTSGMSDEEIDEALHLSYDLFMQAAADRAIPLTVTYDTYSEGYYWQTDHYEVIHDYLLLTLDELNFITIREDDLID